MALNALMGNARELILVPKTRETAQMVKPLGEEARKVCSSTAAYSIHLDGNDRDCLFSIDPISVFSRSTSRNEMTCIMQRCLLFGLCGRRFIIFVFILLFMRSFSSVLIDKRASMNGPCWISGMGTVPSHRNRFFTVAGKLRSNCRSGNFHQTNWTYQLNWK